MSISTKFALFKIAYFALTEINDCQPLERLVKLWPALPAITKELSNVLKLLPLVDNLQSNCKLSYLQQITDFYTNWTFLFLAAQDWPQRGAKSTKILRILRIFAAKQKADRIKLKSLFCDLCALSAFAEDHGLCPWMNAKGLLRRDVRRVAKPRRTWGRITPTFRFARQIGGGNSFPAIA